MVKLRNFGNDLSLLYTHMMHSLPCMLSQGRGLGPTMPQVSRVLANPLIDRATSLTNVRGPTGTGNDIDAFHVLRVNRVFHRPKGATDSIERSKSCGDTIFLQNPRNPVRGSLDVRKAHTPDMIIRNPSDGGLLPGPEEGFSTEVPLVTILLKDIKEVSLFRFQALLIRNSNSTGGKRAKNP